MDEETKKKDAIDACRLLNELQLDFMIGGRSFDIYEAAEKARESGEFQHAVSLGLTRMSLNHIFISLTKWYEIYERYLYLFPKEIKHTAKALVKDIDARNVRDFRNKYIGHVLDNDTKKPLSIEETDAFVDDIIKGDIASFILWVNNPETVDEKNVSGKTHIIKDAILKEFNLTDDDLYPKK